jgi:hypothetical protein
MPKRQTSTDSTRREIRLLKAAARLRRAVIDFLEALVAVEKAGSGRSKGNRKWK